MQAILIMGKELRGDPERGRKELAARAAAASILWRNGAAWVATLEAELREQRDSGSVIVQRMLAELGVPSDCVMARNETYSTRQEVLVATRLVEQYKIDELVVVTASYHLTRTERYFLEHLPEGRFVVLAPESQLAFATPKEKKWVQAGIPSAIILEYESQREDRWSFAGRFLSPLRPHWRWSLEVMAGKLLRRVW